VAAMKGSRVSYQPTAPSRDDLTILEGGAGESNVNLRRAFDVASCLLALHCSLLPSATRYSDGAAISQSPAVPTKIYLLRLASKVPPTKPDLNGSALSLLVTQASPCACTAREPSLIHDDKISPRTLSA